MLRSLAALALALAPLPASAFCGFYVAGADTQLYNDATMVALMREGTRTVLSMQNSYQGPPEAFAMVVPVPQVLQKENVRTLPRDIFRHLDQLAAPRLVEYWEQDPCAPVPDWDGPFPTAAMPDAVQESGGRPGDFGVKIEARFEVGEYDVVILSAKDSTGLDRWLRAEKYNIPVGADAVLRPYVEAGTKFFVAKVMPDKVTFEDGRAVLSPLRVHYDEERFQLPVRLGLLNSQGEQDLIVHVLAQGQRYEAANYENAFIPTNLRVQDAVRHDFGGFYESLFRQVSRRGTVVTEYSWDAATCDPCPTPPLDGQEILTLGGDVIGAENPWGFVLTRLHYRYDKDGLGEDLVFRAAPPVVGGRGTPDAEGELAEQGATPSGNNQFQGRYVILHRWEGPVACEDPGRGRWGGPPSGAQETVSAPSKLTARPSSGAPAALASLLVDAIPGVTPIPAAEAVEPAQEAAEDAVEKRRCATSPVPAAAGALWLPLLALLRRRGAR